MKIIEGGPRWFGDVIKVRRKYGLTTWAFEIERHGAANSPKTTYTILPDTKLDETQQAQVAAAKLHDLKRDTAAAASAAFAEDLINGSESLKAKMTNGRHGASVPIDVARQFHEQLKNVPKQQVEAFLQMFGIERVSQLRAADEAQAREFITTHAILPF
jgi:hypothetical protein